MKSRNLDLLRSFAVLLVVGYHLARFFNVRFDRLRVADFGLLGVMLFFVHTTLVLMFSLERQQGQSSASANAHPTGLFLPFMTRRFFRIYPLSVLVVICVWLFRIPSDLQFGRFDLVHQTAANLAANLLLIQNITRQKANPGPLWSLPLEFQMYLSLPALFVFARRVRAWWAMIVFWCLTVALWFALGFASGMLPLSDGAIRSPAEALLKFTRFAPCFLPGIIAYQLWRRPRELPGFLLPVFLLLCCGVFVLIPSNEPIEAGWFICLGVGVGVCFFREAPDGRLARFAQTIAQYSYGIYLLHYLAIWIGFVAFRTLNIAWQALIFIATLVTLPVILYHTVEAPMILQGVKIANRVTRTPSPEDAEGFSRKQTAQPLLVKGGLP
ncbi:MAG: acyltransferase [Candidatus Acidiferrales bacterium]|jgi:peptidoglycan/LPS O-acetylase OafA/YrhL